MTNPIYTTYPCGCRVRRGTYGDYVQWCPLHKAAPDLLEHLKGLIAWANIGDDSPWRIMRDSCLAAMAKAEGGAA
jgi:hypothetical protein